MYPTEQFSFPDGCESKQWLINRGLFTSISKLYLPIIYSVCVRVRVCSGSWTLHLFTYYNDTVYKYCKESNIKSSNLKST